MEWEEPNGRPCPFPRPVPYRCWKPIELMLILLEVVEQLVMLVEKKIITLSGHYHTQISKRYRAQCFKEDAVRRTSISSEGNGWGMSGTTRR